MHCLIESTIKMFPPLLFCFAFVQAHSALTMHILYKFAFRKTSAHALRHYTQFNINNVSVSECDEYEREHFPKHSLERTLIKL